MPTVDLVMSADARMDRDTAPTTNFDTENVLYIGEHNGAVTAWRSWIKPNFSSIPSGATFISAVLKLTPVTDLSSNARTMSAHRILKTVVANQITWNVYSTGNNWGTGGCSNSTTDYNGTIEMGNMAVPASPTLNTQLSMTFSEAGVAELKKMYDGTYVNNGIILFVDTQIDDGIAYASTEHATSAYRPIITLTYQMGGGFFF